MLARTLPLICLICLALHGTVHAEAVDGTTIPRAARTSRITTSVMTIGGFGLAYATGHGTGSDFPGTAVAGTVVGSLGLVAGPSVGWFMRGQPARAWAGIGLRAVGGALLARGIQKEDEDGKGEGLEYGGAAIVLGSLAWDLVTVGKAPSASSHARRVWVEPVLIAQQEVRSTPGLAARTRF